MATIDKGPLNLRYGKIEEWAIRRGANARARGDVGARLRAADLETKIHRLGDAIALEEIATYHD